MCPRCTGTRTRWFVSGTDRNLGIRFYKCPNQADGGPYYFWLWEDQYAFYITEVGINLLIEAAGGGSNVMFGMGRAMDDIRNVARNTMMICLLMLFVVLAKS
uniref:Zinc finger GRF-type domain-containing protein n=1 Tax=Triticum urartu TaxID=4572 RepID=A0A8R7QQH1_TRIUA